MTVDLTTLVKEACGRAFPEWDASQLRVVPASDAKFGDYQCNEALRLAKAMRLNPREAGMKIAGELKGCEAFEKVDVAGPGFLNLTVSHGWLASRLGALDESAHLGVAQVGAGRKVVIDYSSPNAAKQMHIGHIRSTVIGDAIKRLFLALGYTVIADNHLGDWGTQFGILIKGYRELLTQEERDNLTVAALEKCYVLSAAKAKEADGVWKEDCKRELVLLQQGEKEHLALWRKFIDISIGEFERIYKKLGVSFDTYRGESFYNDKMPGVVKRLQEMGLAVESEGALVVNLEKENLGVAIVRKSDGGYNYTTSDLACVESREEEYHPERIVYVTDARQKLHFAQWFTIARLMGHKDVQLVHVPFGLMTYQGRAISTREGNLIKLDELLAEAERRAYEIVKERGLDRAVASQIGIGAVKYADLSHDPATDIDFTWEKALSLEGNSGPYLQYAYARICSLIGKAATDGETQVSLRTDGETQVSPHPFNKEFVLSSPYDRLLALALLEFPGAVSRAAQAYKPSILADYLFQTAQLYSSFYQNAPILKSDEPLRASRLRLCALTGRVLKAGLNILGIETPEHI